MEKKTKNAEEETKKSEDAAITGKSAEGGLPHGPTASVYDAHEKEVLDAKAADQLRVLRDRNRNTEDPNNAPA